MKIGLFSPYLDTLGGGEQYLLSVASVFARKNEVDVFWDDATVLDKARQRFSLSLEEVRIRPLRILGSTSVARYSVFRTYDAFIWMSDGSVPWGLGTTLIVIFQFPVPWVSQKNILTWAHLKTIPAIVCYSEFVKQHLKSELGREAVVIPPGIDPGKYHAGKKKNIILTVGRFTLGMNRKKQEILIDSFKRLCRNGLRSWTLVLAGGVRSGDEGYIEDLKSRARGFPIRFFPNCPSDTLFSLYADAALYWHAAGFGEDLRVHPDHAEHFGITTLEAMASGCVPLVFSGGGQAELVENAYDGFLWKTREELEKKTVGLIQDVQLRKKLSAVAQKKPDHYLFETLASSFTKLIPS